MRKTIIMLALIASGPTFALDCKDHAQNLLIAASETQVAMDTKEEYLADIFQNLEVANSQLAITPPKDSKKAFETFTDVIVEVEQRNLDEQEQVNKKMSLLKKGLKSLIINCFN